MKNQFQVRKQILINTDPQRRCYYGVNAKEELVWTDWEVLERNVPEDKKEERLKFWRELNDYAVSQGRESSEYRIVSLQDGSVA